MSSSRLWIVTGASGFLGLEIVRQLVDARERVRVVTRREVLPSELRELGVESARADLNSVTDLTAAFVSAPGTQTIVVHCAGAISIATKRDPRTWETNVGGTERVIAACRRTRVMRLVYVSSVHALPVPHDVSRPVTEITDFSDVEVDGDYAESKAAATARVLAATDLQPVVVHPSGLLGPAATGFLGTLVARIAAGKMPLVVRGGHDLVDVRDVAAGTIAAAQRGSSGEGYLLTGEYVAIPELARMVADRAGVRRPLVLPLWVAAAAAPLAEWWAIRRDSTALFTPYSLRTLATNARYSTAKARAELSYSPRPLKQTIHDMVTGQ